MAGVTSWHRVRVTKPAPPIVRWAHHCSRLAGAWTPDPSRPGSSVPGRAGVPQDRGPQPLGGEQGQLDLQAVLADGTAEALLCLADPVPDGVLVQRQPFGRGHEAAAFLQEDTERITQHGVVAVVVRKRPEGLD